MLNKYTYAQPCKNKIRHEALFYAIDFLTTNRNKACCVERSYVRKVYDYFMSLDESKEKIEAGKIDTNYISKWERLHDSCVGHKRTEELVVCYLSGPEPENDFRELTDLGILAQNIWAFEHDTKTYTKALASYTTGEFNQPKIVKMPIEQFFKQTPKKFDIVYIDACGAIPSSQHALRCVASLCKFHRLNSPGIIITNFACPDMTNPNEEDSYIDLISKYFLFKKYPNEKIIIENGEIKSCHLSNIYNDIKENFLEYYGEFISAILRDVSSILIPVQRFAHSTFMNTIASNTNNTFEKDMGVSEINLMKNNSLGKFFIFANYIYELSSQKNGVSKITQLINECQGLDGFSMNIYKCFYLLTQLKNNDEVLNVDIRKIKDYFDQNNEIYQFLDKPNSNLFFDLIINQIAYPLHYNSEGIRRYHYKAKQTEMFTDVLVLDEARYIYEWLPTVHQVESAFKNLSWQYIFRFALDGLTKNRIDYNNEYFFQGTVLSKNIEGFESKVIKVREKII